MGKGLALQFKRCFPKNFAAYRQWHAADHLHPGAVIFYRENGKTILNFATKDHWRNPSRIEWIEAGMRSLLCVVANEGIESVAIPALGCGLGGLQWSEVEAVIRKELTGESLPEFVRDRIGDLHVELYPPREMQFIDIGETTARDAEESNGREALEA